MKLQPGDYIALKGLTEQQIDAVIERMEDAGGIFHSQERRNFILLDYDDFISYVSDFKNLINDDLYRQLTIKQVLGVQDDHITETFRPLESDPNGIDQHTVGAKLDAGKNRLDLVLGGFSRALMAVGEVGTFGANKYTDNGWMEVPDGRKRYSDALLRHYFKDVTGEVLDPDSQLTHAAHLAWNALARLELLLLDIEVREI